MYDYKSLYPASGETNDGKINERLTCLEDVVRRLVEERNEIQKTRCLTSIESAKKKLFQDIISLIGDNIREEVTTESVNRVFFSLYTFATFQSFITGNDLMHITKVSHLHKIEFESRDYKCGVCNAVTCREKDSFIYYNLLTNGLSCREHFDDTVYCENIAKYVPNIVNEVARRARCPFRDGVVVKK